MKKRILGSSGLEVSAIGLGCWGMSGAYGAGDRKESIATIHESIDQGINFIDTADIYGNGHNEILVGEALKGIRKKLILATKFGFVGDEDGELSVDGRPEYVKKACDASLKRLKTDYIDLYYLHRLDKDVPIEDTVGAMAGLVEKGKVRSLGLSEVSATTINRALSVYPIAALQSEYSLNTHDLEKSVIPACRKNNIAIVPFSPLGRGLLTLSIKSEADLPVNDFRRKIPRFQGDNFTKNLKLLSVLGEIAIQKNHTPAQVALAWLLHRGNDIIPIPGMKRKKYVKENILSVEVSLSRDEINMLDTLSKKFAGGRYME
ncbi:MAG TPA: aldo/keto reductase [Bacteroidetes bacterium]|nr:aldo/keto reductase [Bacteroidota bacterium]